MGQSDNSEACLRALARDDVDELIALWIASWGETMPALDFEARRGWIAGLLHHPAYVTIVATLAARPVGFASREGTHLHQLVVAPGVKGRGVATRLLDAVKADAPTGLTLDVNQANPRAVRFYEREGFVVTGEGVNPASGLATFAMAWRR